MLLVSAPTVLTEDLAATAVVAVALVVSVALREAAVVAAAAALAVAAAVTAGRPRGAAAHCSEAAVAPVAVQAQATVTAAPQSLGELQDKTVDFSVRAVRQQVQAAM